MMNLREYEGENILLDEDQRSVVLLRTLLNYLSGELEIMQECVIDNLVIQSDAVLLTEEQARALQAYLNETYTTLETQILETSVSA